MKFLHVILSVSFLLLVLPLLVVSASLNYTSGSNISTDSSISSAFNDIPLSNITRESSISPFLNGTLISNITQGSSISTSLNTSSPYWLSPSGNIAFGFYKLACTRPSSYCPDRYVVGIWFVKSSFKTLVWTANGDDLRMPSSIHFTSEGNLVLRVMPDNKEKRLIPDIKEPLSYGVMQDDGNLVFYNSRSEIIWESFDYPTDTIPGGQNLRSGVDLNSFGKRLHSLNGENGLSVQDSNGLVSTSSLNVTNIPTTVRSPELHRIGHFSVFEGHPRWNKSTLTYSISTNFIIDYINQNDILMVLQSSFGRWSSVVQLNFTETKAYDSADIKIGFYYGDHGDGLPFTRGTFAHAFEPEIGMLHFNADVVWSVDFKLERRKDAIDLESVATHEIGHLLGLNHSSDPDAVMFWSIPRRTKKRDLTEDDVLGVRALYRANPNYRRDHHASSGDNSVCLIHVLVPLIITGILVFVPSH